MKENREPTVIEAMEYIINFGGYDKAWSRRDTAFFLKYSDYLYHKTCIFVYVNSFRGEK